MAISQTYKGRHQQVFCSIWSLLARGRGFSPKGWFIVLHVPSPCRGWCIGCMKDCKSQGLQSLSADKISRGFAKAVEHEGCF